MNFKDWKQNKTALTNNVYEKNNIICKQYKNDEFSQTFGNNEELVLKLLKRKFEYKDWNVLCYEKIIGKNIDSKKLTFKQIDEIILALKKFHKLPIKNISKIPFKKAWKLIKNYGPDEYNDKFNSIVKKALKIIKKDKVLVHNDLIDGNILKNKSSIEFIDFEYSGISNRLVDIASFTTERKISKENENYFIKKYFGNTSFNEKNYLIIKMFLFIYIYKWALFKYQLTKNKVFNEIANERLNSIKRFIN